MRPLARATSILALFFLLACASGPSEPPPSSAATSAESAVVAVAIGFGNGEFAEPQVFDLPEGSPTVAAGDLDGDGIADIVTVASDDTTNINDARLVLRYSEGHVVL